MPSPITLDPSIAETTPTGIRPAARLSAARKVYASEAAEVVALDEVDLDVTAGAFTAIMGPSGSGKSTMMHCLAGLDRLTDGSVEIGDAELTSMSERDLTLLRRTRIGFVFQAFNLIPSLSAIENILLPLSLSGRSPAPGVLERVVETLGLDGRLRHRPAELSGGQQQRVAVARALVAEPEIVFADEPTGNLDTRSGAEILRFLRDAVDDAGQTTVMVTHDPAAAAWADRVVFLVDGRIDTDLADPTADQVIDVMRGLGR
ncbi:MAG: ABC transporter ATP-binding protein [Actinomycetota bacterium]